MPDTRKTLSLIGLLLYALYQTGGFVETLYDGNGPLRKSLGNWFWPVRWEMFTGLSRSHTVMDFEAAQGGQWVHLPMEEWYPAHWESGYRWERPAVFQYRSLQEPFLAAACTHTSASQVRMVQRSWDKTLGQSEQPQGEVREKVLRVWDCSRPPPRPSGRVL